MLAAAISLILLGIIFVFVFPWVGVPAAIVGIVLLILFILGFGRRAASSEHRF